ncbi:hypothetical protein LCGC14_2122910 [marine sediment metagenome]|uniref:Uncharacterized protein n=1 Tax=marine sediment metagenome TaxID=412755 RepID=A0A0F9EQU0_9ZZZZ
MNNNKRDEREAKWDNARIDIEKKLEELKKEFEFKTKENKDKYYHTYFTCDNCTCGVELKIKKGIKIDDILDTKPKCPYCGCLFRPLRSVYLEY